MLTGICVTRHAWFSETTEAIFGLDFEMDNFFRFLALMLRGPFGGSSGGMSFGFPGMMGSQPGFMGGPSGFMGNQPGFMGGPSGFMGNQPGFMGGPSGFMGNQPGLKGGPSGFMGNQPYLGSNTG